jgi:multidrug resistance efflux pump
MLEDNGTNLDEAQRKVVAERLYNLAASPHISEKALLKMRDQEIALATVRQNDERLKQNERKLEQAQETIDLQKRKIEALEAQAEAAAKAAERAKEAVKGGTMDDGTREALLAEVDAIMLGKPKPQKEAA